MVSARNSRFGLLPFVLGLGGVSAFGCGNDPKTTQTSASGTETGEGEAEASEGATEASTEATTEGSAEGGCVEPSISGVVRGSGGTPLEGARVTVSDGSLFAERRTGADGRFSVSSLPPGAFAVGASQFGLEYQELAVTVGDDCPEVELELGPETEQGRWTVIGDTSPEFFAGTPSGTLLPDGRMMFCHDTQDSVMVDPTSGAKTYGAFSLTSQGCHMQTVLSDGRVIFVGGQDPSDPASFVNGVPYVKSYDPVADAWTVLPELSEARWYPGLTRLADERLLVCGGGQPPAAARTETCEVFDPNTNEWANTGSMLLPTEYSPTVLLPSGDVLATWSPPQLYDPGTGVWTATGEFVQPDRGFPDHSDHTLILPNDGAPLAIGVENSAGLGMVERYDPGAGTWAVMASPEIIRGQPEVVQLPDGRILAAGGFWQGGAATDFDPTWPAVAEADLYDPIADTWRAVSPMQRAREYHALTLVAPDGSVVTTSGGSDQASGNSTENSVERFDPPYLFRGIRPQIDSLVSAETLPGGSFDFEFSLTEDPTSVVLLGAGAVTHWVDGGTSRRVELDFETVSAGQIVATVPADTNRVPPGLYLLYLLVDDIPSDGRLVMVLRE